MSTYSEQAIRSNCPHCDPSSYAFQYLLTDTDHFRVACDANCIVEGHILIVPKRHIGCVGEFSDSLLTEFEAISLRVREFLHNEYGHMAAFEHGRVGQTVFHSHVHLLPADVALTAVLAQADASARRIASVRALRAAYAISGKYLFLSVGSGDWLIRTDVGYPGFFRERLAQVLGVPERADWKAMRADTALMRSVAELNAATQRKWEAYWSGC